MLSNALDSYQTILKPVPNAILLVMAYFILLELEYAIRNEIKAREPLWLEYGTPSYLIKILSFPLSYIEFITYIRGNLVFLCLEFC